MSYEKQTWQTGDIVTAEKLNHIEDGIVSSGDVLVVTFTADYHNGAYANVTTDHTYTEVKAAIEAGKVVIFQQHLNNDGEICAQAYAAMFEDFVYAVNFDLNFEDAIIFGTRYYLPSPELEIDPEMTDFSLQFVK